MRSPASFFEDLIFMPCFLPAVEMNPRTLWGCHPVAVMISARVAPFARAIISRILALLLSARGAVALACACLAAFLLALASFLRVASLTLFLTLGVPFFWLAPFFEEVFSGAPCAPCAATVAAVSLVFAFVMVVWLPFLVPFRSTLIHPSPSPQRQGNSERFCVQKSCEFNSDFACLWGPNERSWDWWLTATERRAFWRLPCWWKSKSCLVSLAALRAKYREVFEEETRCRHREHLFRRIAWRLQALAEGDLTERARERASQLAGDADLRMVAPRDFFMVEGEPVRTTRGAGNRRPADDRLPLPGTLLSRKWKGRTLLVEVLADGNAQQKGWAVCPSKSLPAQAIEESVLGRIRQARGGAADAAAWEQMGRERQRELIEGLVISARAPPARYP